ncbi:hypothetical protein J4404_02605 [Candidatus Woesearchaeota archaeon]|nr:hypothetical protein [Candidatus Woesearchaeota archaeon]
MYHPAKVLNVLSHKDKGVISSDESTQAVLEMWDDNQFTFLVDEKISSSIKQEDIVLVDYRSSSNTTMIPNHKIIKIFDKETGEKIWSVYKDYHKKSKEKESIHSQQASRGYMG